MQSATKTRFAVSLLETEVNVTFRYEFWCWNFFAKTETLILLNLQVCAFMNMHHTTSEVNVTFRYEFWCWKFFAKTETLILLNLQVCAFMNMHHTTLCLILHIYSSNFSSNITVYILINEKSCSINWIWWFHRVLVSNLKVTVMIYVRFISFFISFQKDQKMKSEK